MAFESGFQAGLGLPMVEHPLARLMEKLAGGYETGAKMAAMPQQLELMNALREAQTRKAKAQAEQLEEGIVTPTGLAAEYEAARQLEQKHGADNPYVKALKSELERRSLGRESLTQQRESVAQSRMFANLPQDEKRRVLGYSVGMGYTPDEAIQEFNRGKTLRQMADEKNFDLENVNPIYPLAGENIKQMQQRQGFNRELNVLDDLVTDGMNQFGQTIAGYSPSQIISAISNDDVEKQGKFLAARALSPEMAALRLKVAGGQVGIEAIREMQDKSLANVKTIESLVTPEVRTSMNRHISDWLNKAVNAFDTHLGEVAGLGKKAKGIAKKMAEEDKMPEFQTKEEFAVYYKSLSPNEKERIKNRLR